MILRAEIVQLFAPARPCGNGGSGAVLFPTSAASRAGWTMVFDCRFLNNPALAARVAQFRRSRPGSCRIHHAGCARASVFRQDARFGRKPSAGIRRTGKNRSLWWRLAALVGNIALLQWRKNWRMHLHEGHGACLNDIGNWNASRGRSLGEWVGLGRDRDRDRRTWRLGARISGSDRACDRQTIRHGGGCR